MWTSKRAKGERKDSQVRRSEGLSKRGEGLTSDGAKVGGPGSHMVVLDIYPTALLEHC